MTPINEQPQQSPDDEKGQPFAASNPTVRAVEKAVEKLEQSRTAIERDIAQGRDDMRDVRDRLTRLEEQASGIAEKFKELGPKIDDILGFIRHAVPNVATKDGLEKRPTRRQSIFDLMAFITFVGVVVALTVHFAK